MPRSNEEARDGQAIEREESIPPRRPEEEAAHGLCDLIVAAQEGIEISEARAEEVYKIVFEEPPVAFFRLTQAGAEREERFVKALANAAPGVRFDVARRGLLAVDGGAPCVLGAKASSWTFTVVSQRSTPLRTRARVSPPPTILGSFASGGKSRQTKVGRDRLGSLSQREAGSLAAIQM